MPVYLNNKWQRGRGRLKISFNPPSSWSTCDLLIFLWKDTYRLKHWDVSKAKRAWTSGSNHKTECNHCVTVNMWWWLDALLMLKQQIPTEGSQSTASVRTLASVFPFCNVWFWSSSDPVCQHGGQARVQQVPYQGGPPLPLSVHLAVLHRQLQLRYSATVFLPTACCQDHCNTPTQRDFKSLFLKLLHHLKLKCSRSM